MALDSYDQRGGSKHPHQKRWSGFSTNGTTGLQVQVVPIANEGL